MEVRSTDEKDSRFHARLMAGALTVTGDGRLVYSFARASLSERFVGGKASPRAGTPSSTRVSSFIGDDPAHHSIDAPTFEHVSLGEVFPGIDITLRATGRNVEKIFTVDPGVDSGRIRIAVEGATALRVAADGALIAMTGEGELRFTPPVAFQTIAGRQTSVQAAYVIDAADDTYGFTVGAYDPQHALVIDPLLQATYLGGNDSDQVEAVAVHPVTGDVIVVGGTPSTNLPCTTASATCGTGPQPTPPAGSNAFIARLSADLTQLKQATYFGGSGSDFAGSIAVHPATGDVLVAGFTSSTNLPCTFAGGVCANAPQPVLSAGLDAFVARFSSDLTQLKQATYLGGTGSDSATGIAVNPRNGEIIVTGGTSSTNFPCTTSAVGNCSNGALSVAPANSNGFVARFSADLVQLRQATYVGGSGRDGPHGVAVHATRNEILVAGVTTSSNFPCTTASAGCADGAQPAHGPLNDDAEDGFIVRLSADLTQTLQATYLGGAHDDYVNAIEIDPANGDVIVAGQTYSADFPCTKQLLGCLAGAQPSLVGPPSTRRDGFVARLSADLTQLRQATYIGGDDDDDIGALVIDPSTGRIFVAGNTLSQNLPCTIAAGSCAVAAQAAKGAPLLPDGFVAAFSSSLRHLVQATYLGGSDREVVQGLAQHPVNREIFVAGWTSSTNFPCTTAAGICLNGAQPAHAADGNTNDGFIARLTPDLTFADTTPGPFAFQPINDAPLSTLTTSGPVQVSGIVGQARVYIEGAVGSTYCISSTSGCTCDVSIGFTAAPGSISNNQYVCVRHLSAQTPDQITQSVFNVGSASGTFRVATGSLLALGNCTLDVDGNNLVDALTDGLMLIRAMFGLTGTAVTNNAIGGGTPARTTWAQIQQHLNNNCGTSFAQ